ncbi:glycosyltransferase [Candidatus Parcubacteria bacterium]|nr:glycosyltransferase [Candidatus Parcubacteria bacterium]
MKVLMIGSDRMALTPGSAVSSRLKEYAGLVDELHVVLLSDRGHNLSNTKLSDNLWVYPTNSINKFLRPIDAARIGRGIVCDLITAQDPFECGWAGLKVKKALRIPLEVQLHTDPFSERFGGFLNSIRKIIAERVIAEADSLRVVSSAVADKLIKRFNLSAGRVSILPIYVDRARLDTGSVPFDLHERFGWQFVMLTVSRLTKEKNLPLALKVLEKAKLIFPNIGLVIVGSGPEEGHLRSLSKSLGVEKNVAFAGWQEDLTSYYRSANLFLQTSDFEGYGLSLVEAGLAGLPVLTTAVGIANDLENDKDAIICPVGDTECLLRGAHALIEDNAKRETMRMSLRDKLDTTLLTKTEYLGRMASAWQGLLAQRKNMKLLVITQKVSKNDPVLGAYHRWIEEFHKYSDPLTVICLEQGEMSLSHGVKVLSLGKEAGLSRPGYLARFYKYIWQERGNYDAVFVHMNEEYVLLAGWWWRLTGRPVAMFRNHIQGTWKTPIAVWLSNVVFCTSPQSFTARYKKTKVVPAGTDLSKFKDTLSVTRMPRSILSMGRIGPVKNLDVLVRALKILDDEGADFVASIVGDAEASDQGYYEALQKESQALVEKGKLVFRPSVPNTKTPEMYGSHEIFVNMTNSGSFDKTVLSAMMSGSLVVLSNTSFAGVVSSELMFNENDARDFANKLEDALNMSAEQKQAITHAQKKYVEESHGLEKTIEIIVRELSRCA